MSMPGSPDPAGSVCYRHPDRRAGVRCQRCERPICPSCMQSAAVGFQCPECTQQGAKQQRLVTAWRQQSAPRVTYGLIAVNVVFFVIDNVLSGSLGGLYADFGTRFALRASGAVFSDGTVLTGGVAEGEWWRIVSGGFLHAGILHLGFNMFALYSLGGVLERVLGPVRFGAIYVVSLFGGSLGALAMSDPWQSTVGASGAIFGIFGAFALLQMSRGMSPMAGGIGPTILLNLFITFAIPGISIGGHLGGLLTGGAVSYLLIGANRRQAIERERSQPAMLVAVGVLGLALFGLAVLVANLTVDQGSALIGAG